MKIEKIDSRIAALYLGQKADHKGPLGTIFDVPISTITLSDLSWEIVEITPHLRRLESLTEEEARELYGIKYGDSFHVDSEAIAMGFTYLEDFWECSIELYNDEGKLLIGCPVVWLKLLEWGIDLFGLIDAGLAKEVQKPNT